MKTSRMIDKSEADHTPASTDSVNSDAVNSDFVSFVSLREIPPRQRAADKAGNRTSSSSAPGRGMQDAECIPFRDRGQDLISYVKEAEKAVHARLKSEGRDAAWKDPMAKSLLQLKALLECGEDLQQRETELILGDAEIGSVAGLLPLPEKPEELTLSHVEKLIAGSCRFLRMRRNYSLVRLKEIGLFSDLSAWRYLGPLRGETAIRNFSRVTWNECRFAGMQAMYTDWRINEGMRGLKADYFGFDLEGGTGTEFLKPVRACASAKKDRWCGTVIILSGSARKFLPELPFQIQEGMLDFSSSSMKMLYLHYPYYFDDDVIYA